VGNLVTLKNALGVGDKANEDSQEVEVVKPQAKKPAFNQNAMYVSYAKDLIVAGKTKEEAIKIIQQLREELQ